jgi:subtilisin family serine protease
MVRSRSQRSKWDYLSPKHFDFVPGLLVVRIKHDVVADVPPVRAGAAVARRASALPQALDEPFRDLLRKKKLKQLTPIFAPMTKVRRLMKAAMPSASAAFASSVWESESEDLRGINLMRLSESVDARRVEKDLRGTRGIEYVHRVPARWLAAGEPKAVSSDPMVNRQWGLRAIHWFDPQVNSDAHDVRVAVLDTGIDLTHPDLSGIGAQYTHDGASAEDIVGHGTHVSGIIAADFRNNVGIAGICRCALHVWKIFGDAPASDGQYYVDEIMYQRSLNAARNAGVRALNLSIGGTQSSQTERLLFRRLTDAGVVVVAAMGNEFKEGNPIEYPANYPGVIAVGASNEADRRAPFSNTGRNITLCAPGTNILSCLPMKPSADRPDTQYAAWSGTSMATPHVTAAAALVIAKNGGAKPSDVASLLRRTATKLAQKPSEVGGGLLNLAAALS